MFKLSLAFVTSLVAGQVDLGAYCGALATQCMSVHGLDASTCMAAFNGSSIPLGTAADVDVNTIGCRSKFLMDSAYNMTGSCRFAGPTGGGRCGSVVESMCKVATGICSNVAGASYTDANTCQTAMSGASFAFQWGSKQGSDAAAENSMECRVYHAIASLSLGPVHCSHFGTNLSSPTYPCVGPVTTSATHYCDTLMYNCNGSNAQFTNLTQCQVVAASYPASNDAQNTNAGHNLGCRQYHSQAAALSGASTHCQHAGPTGGGGVCGAARDAWGTIAAAAPCNDPTVNTFLAQLSDDQVDALVPGGFSTTPYSISYDTGKNTQACRIYHATVAATIPLIHCPHTSVSGGGACGTYTSNLCDFISASCGFGSNATYQFKDRDACMSGLTASNGFNITTGNAKPQDTSGNSIECRFYHATVAASYSAGGGNANATDALNQHRIHCGHVLAPAKGSGGCGDSSTTTTAPTPSKNPMNPSSAAALSLMASTIVLAMSIFLL